MTEYVSPTPVDGFLDSDHATLFPRLTAAQIEELAAHGETLSLARGDVLFEQAQRDTPLSGSRSDIPPLGMNGTMSSDTSKRAFARHFAEMLVAMLLGMGVLEGLAALALTAKGSDLTGQPGTFRVMLMGLSMTVPMVLWMRYRGHSARRNSEMAASMLVPSALAALLLGVGAFGVEAAFAVQHVVMVPAMLGVMLWRYDEYARPHAASSPTGSAPASRRPLVPKER